MKIIVTGSKGFIGAHLIAELRRLGHEVLGLDRTVCDLCNYPELKPIVGKFAPEAVFHLAALLPVGAEHEAQKYFANNVNGTLNLLESLRDGNNCKFVYSSTMNVYGKAQYLPVDETHPAQPTNPYGLTKLLGEQVCKYYADNLGYQVTVLRYSGVYGPGRDTGAIASFIAKALAGEPLQINASDQWDALYVKEIVKANILALQLADTKSFNIFNIGAGEALGVKAVAEAIIKLTNSRSELKINDSPSSLAFYYDIAKAKDKLGFHPRSLGDCLKEFITLKIGSPNMKGGKS